MTTVLLILIAVLLFCLIIFFHEFGHFITAKSFGVRVNEFSLGMGPKIFGFTKGDTTYSLRLLPIGGYCAMEGEDEESADARAFCNKKVWKRMIIVVAGAVINILLGIVLCFTQVVQEDVFLSTTLSGVGDAVIVEEGELLPGDKIVAIDGYSIYNSHDLNFMMAYGKGAPADFTVKRQGQKVTVSGVKLDYSNLDGAEKPYAFYVEPIEKTVFSVIGQSAGEAMSITRLVWRCLVDIVTGNYNMNDLAGPVGTAQAIGQAASAGRNFGESVNNIIFVMAMITVNLGVFNLLPLPALDGGRLVFMILEAIRRKPISRKAEGIIHGVGFALLILLMIVVTYNDITRLVGK